MTDSVDERENLLLNTGNLTNEHIEISVTNCTLSLSYKIKSHCFCFNFRLKAIVMLQEHFKVADHYVISDSKNGRYLEDFFFIFNLVTRDWKRGKRGTLWEGKENIPVTHFTHSQSPSSPNN